MMENESNVQHQCNMTSVIQDIKDEQVEQKITLIGLTGEITRLVSAVSVLVETQRKDEEYKLSQKDKKLDGFSDLFKSIALLVMGFALSQI